MDVPILFTAGLASFEFAISDDPIQGQWKIKAECAGKRTVRRFEVKEYGRCCHLLNMVTFTIRRKYVLLKQCKTH